MSAQALARTTPKFLNADPQRLYAHCSALAALVAGRPVWRRALESATPALLRKCLYYTPKVRPG